MKKVTKSNELPAGSIAAEGFGRIDYLDVYRVHAPEVRTETVDRVYTRIMSMPAWVGTLMKIRNSVVGIFGLQTDGGTPQQSEYYPVGSQAMAFTVIARNGQEIVTGEDDKHLNFRAAIHIDPPTGQASLITLVHYHNAGGRLYFSLIKPFHCLIMRTQMKRLLPDKSRTK